jgi:hypothetical protein
MNVAMSPTEPAKIEEAFRKSDCSWILDYPQDNPQRDALLNAVAKEIDEFKEAYHRRFGRWPDPFELLNENKDKATAFFEIFSGPPLSIDARVLIWRLIEGAEIRAVEVRYERKKPFYARITVGERGVTIGERGGSDENFETTHPWDFTILRHLGMLTVSGNLVLEGYYASRFLGP